jgi:hypothetical protein
MVYRIRVSPRCCTVSFTGPTGVRHSVEVTAESVYEAAALGINLLRQEEWADQLAPGTPIEVRARHPATTHTLTLAQVQRWTEGVAASPDEILKKRKVKDLLRR